MFYVQYFRLEKALNIEGSFSIENYNNKHIK